MNIPKQAKDERKKPYDAPLLKLFGGMAAMTAAGSGGKGETTAMGMTMGMTFP